MTAHATSTPTAPEPAASQKRAWRRPSRGTLELVLALVVYTGFALFATWPLVLHLDSMVYLYQANPPGAADLGGSIAHLRELIESKNVPFLPGRIDDFNAPDGLELRWPLNVSSAPSTIVLYVLGLAFGATAAFGLFVLLGYVGSGLAMFLLVRKLTGSPWIGLLIGWAFAFYPFAIVNGEHPHFVHGWVLVVMAWRMLELLAAPTVRNGLLAGAATVLALSWTHYFILLAGVAYAALTAAALAVAASRGELRRHVPAHLASGAVVLGFLFTMRVFLVSTFTEATLPANPLAEVNAGAAKPLMWLIPPADNLVVGSLTRETLAERGWIAVEWTLYLGISVLLLAVLGAVAAWRGPLGRNLRAAAVTAGAVTVAALVFSAPPQVEIFGRLVPTPTYAVFEVASGWRLYSRFVIVAMFGLCILAALGLKALDLVGGRRVGVVGLAVAAIVVPLDLWQRPPDLTYAIETPRIYSALERQPPGTVAEYPLRPIVRIGHYMDLYFQEAHGKRILNGYYAGPDERRALHLAELGDPGTASSLATLGVRYVLVTPTELTPGVPDPGAPGRGFRFLERDEYAALYRVTAAPRPFIYAREGFLGAEGEPGERFQWASGSAAALEVIARCDPCNGVLRFLTASFGHERRLVVSSGEGKVLYRGTIGVGETAVVFPLHFSRRVVLDFDIEPGAQSIQETTGAPDSRAVSIYVKNPRFTRLG